MDGQQILELACRNGAQSAEVYQTSGLSRSASFEANRLKQVETGNEEGVALRVWKDGRAGLAVAQGPADSIALVEKALALSAFSQPEAVDLPHAAPVFHERPRDRVALEQLIAWGEQVIAQIRAACPEVLCGGGYSDETGTLTLLNTAGLQVSYTSSTLSGYMGAEWVRGEDLLQVYEGETVYGVPSPQTVAQQVVQKLNWAKKNSPTLNAQVPVLFTSKAVEVLLGAVSAALNGRQVLQQASPWFARRGETVLSPLLTLSQVPEAEPYATPFDDEGTPTRALDFCRQGVLETFYADRKTARALGLEYAGNGFRGDLGAYPQPGLFNLTIAPGSTPFEDIVRQLENAVIVDQVLGSGASLSGEFSVNVDLGYRVRHGQITGRIKDTMVAGNAYDALKRIVSLSSERNWEGSLLTPALLVESLAVTGRV